jgi:hypothetical protein
LPEIKEKSSKCHVMALKGCIFERALYRAFLHKKGNLIESLERI